MGEHELKTWPGPFEAIIDGRKRFEVRRTDDRAFALGDLIHLREWLPNEERYTGRGVVVRVTYVVPGGAWGLPDHIGVLGIDIEGERQTRARDATIALAAEAYVAACERLSAATEDDYLQAWVALRAALGRPAPKGET